MKALTKSISLICLAALMTTTLTTTAHATAGFTTNPKLPENQREGTVNYFDIFLQPGQSQDLTLIVENVTEQEIAVTTEALAVATNEAGDIVYVPSANLALMQGENIEHTPEFIMPDHLRLHQNRIIIPPNSQSEVTFTVTMPQTQFQGTILGAINIVREPTDAELSQAGNFLFEFANVVAVRMQQVTEPAEPGFEIHSVQADLVMHRATFVVNIINTEKRVIRSTQVNVRIYPEHSDDPIIEFTNESISIAPDSLLPLSIRETESEGIQSGNYIARIDLLYESKEWNFMEPFEITTETAARINEDAINVADDGLEIPILTIAIIAIATVLTTAIIIVLTIKSKSNKKKYQALMKKIQALENPTTTPDPQPPTAFNHQQPTYPKQPPMLTQQPQLPTVSNHQQPKYPQQPQQPHSKKVQPRPRPPQQQNKPIPPKPLDQMNKEELIKFIKERKSNQTKKNY